MGFSDTLVTIIVLLLLFFLGYSAIRHQNLLDTVREIRDIMAGKIDDIKEMKPEVPYA